MGNRIAVPTKNIKHAPPVHGDGIWPGQTGVAGSCVSSGASAIFGINNATDAVPTDIGIPAGNGVWGHTKVLDGSGVCGSVEPTDPDKPVNRRAAGVTGIGPIAGRFLGDVVATGHIYAENGTLHCYDVNMKGADCAEEFDISGSEQIAPGTVMVLDGLGMLKPSHKPYDKKVAGILSGAGDYKPGMVLDKRQSEGIRMPLALMGKAYCRVNADHGSIEVGDLLTTSPTPGCAMKADDPHKAFGAVIGKALRPLQTGIGLIPVLVALQ